MELKDLIQTLVETKALLKDYDDAYEMATTPLKETKKNLESQIIETFKQRGEYSTRIEKATASLSVKKTPQITDEKALVEGLKDKGLVEYVEERVSDIFKDSVLKTQAKAEELLPGITIKETEYLSIRPNDKEDPRKLSTNEFVTRKEE